MKLLSYEVWSGKSDLHFSRLNFSELNLLVGNTGSGKTRLLNTIFNAALIVTQKRSFVGAWDMTLEHHGHIFHWVIETRREEEGEKATILKELVASIQANGQDEILVERTNEKFQFLGNDLPKLEATESSISLLRDEERISPLYSGLSLIMRRSFAGSDLDDAGSYQSISQRFLKKMEKSPDLTEIFQSGLNLNGRLYVLAKFLPKLYDKVCTEFKNVFPFVTSLEVLSADRFGFHAPGVIPVFAMKEKLISQWIPLNEFSAGMRKVLLILTDILTMPKEGALYLIDEYENSLGINAINFFPSVLWESGGTSQYIITTHHPYIIGNVPVENWIILHRRGSEILVKLGSEMKGRFARSKQQAFVQLMNDPFFLEGVE